MRTRINNVRVALPAVLAAGAIAAALAGCGGGGGGGGGGAYGAVGSGARHPATTTSHSAAPAAVASAGIPQRNGGDMDSDNNGGPSDGDGNQ